MGCWKNQVNNQGILKQENQETKAQLPLGICFEKPKVWTEEQERGFRQKAPLVQGQLEKPLDAEEHFFPKNIWVSRLWLEKSDYPP